MTGRDVPPTLATLLQLLELEQPRVVSTADMREYSAKAGVTWPVDVVVRRLRERGWLLPLSTRGVWEFAPAARAGAFSSGDPFVELRATLRRDPDAPFSVAAESAAYLLGLATRRPSREVLSAPQGVRPTNALNRFRMVHWTRPTTLTSVDGLPTWSVDTLIAFMAARPSGYRDWPNVGDWILQAAAQLAPDMLALELGSSPRSAWARAAYLLERGGQADAAADLLERAPDGNGPYYLGVREEPGRYYSRYDVVDSTGLEPRDDH